jgi:hypothetical protein
MDQQLREAKSSKEEAPVLLRSLWPFEDNPLPAASWPGPSGHSQPRQPAVGVSHGHRPPDFTIPCVCLERHRWPSPFIPSHSCPREGSKNFLRTSCAWQAKRYKAREEWALSVPRATRSSTTP